MFCFFAHWQQCFECKLVITCRKCCCSCSLPNRCWFPPRDQTMGSSLKKTKKNNSIYVLTKQFLQPPLKATFLEYFINNHAPPPIIDESFSLKLQDSSATLTLYAYRCHQSAPSRPQTPLSQDPVVGTTFQSMTSLSSLRDLATQKHSELKQHLIR